VTRAGFTARTTGIHWENARDNYRNDASENPNDFDLIDAKNTFTGNETDVRRPNYVFRERARDRHGGFGQFAHHVPGVIFA